MGLLKPSRIKKRSVVGASLYLLTFLLRSKVRLPFIAPLRSSKPKSFKLSKSKLNSKNKLLKLRVSFNGNFKRKRRGA